MAQATPYFCNIFKLVTISGSCISDYVFILRMCQSLQHSCIQKAMFLPPPPPTRAQNFLCGLPLMGNCGGKPRSRNSALLHLLPEHTKVKTWICPQSLLGEFAFTTLPALINLAEMFLTITISTLSLESVAPIEEKNCSLFGQSIVICAPKRICRTYVCKNMTYTSLCHKIFPIKWVN